MLRGQHQGEFIVGVRDYLEQVVKFGGQLATNDGQVDLAVGDTPTRATGAVNLQLHRDIRIFLPKQSDHAWHQIGARGLAGPDHKGTSLEVMEIIQGPTSLLALAQDAVAVTQQQMACLGELGLATATIKEGNIQLLLQILDLQAHRRLGDIKAVSRLLEAALAGNGPQDTELVEGERQIGHGVW